MFVYYFSEIWLWTILVFIDVRLLFIYMCSFLDSLLIIFD